jgi:PKD repeat protein
MPFALAAQTCSINIPADACVDDIVNFKVTASQTITAYNWDFGDGSTSVQATPGYKYTTAATRTVKITVSLSGGGTCNASKTITIHPKPVSKFSIDNANTSFCFNKNKVCITDNSTPGPTGNAIVQRVLLWDDGAADNSNNPTAQKTVCHTYLQEGVFTLLMETTDDKGCQSKSTQTISIVRDFKADFNTQLVVVPTNCKYSVCFTNNTKPKDTANLVSYEWNFGDGDKTSDMAYYDTICHPYDSGTYISSLIVKHTSGCIDTMKTTIVITKPDIKFNLKIPKAICFGDKVTLFNDATNPGGDYRWYVKDSASGIEEPITYHTNPVDFTPKTAGKYYIKLNLLVGNCQQNGFDSVIVMCPVAKIEARNHRLCEQGDTTYFCNNSCYYASYHHKQLWDLAQGQACTTDTKKGINVNKDCRFSVDDNPKHLYTYNGSASSYACFNPTLTITDTVTGCQSIVEKTVFIGLPPFDDLEIEDKAQKYCTDIGSQDIERLVSFYITGLSCNQSWEMYLNFDSAVSSTKFNWVTPNPPPQYTYSGTGNPNGDVTIGFAVVNGSTGVFKSCTEMLPIVGKTCADTIWYHNKFNIAKVPNPVVSLYDGKGCAPFNFTVRPDDTVQYGVKKIIWNWGDGSSDSVELGPTDTIMPVRYHTYLKNGNHLMQLLMINGRDCGESQYLSVGLGYDNFVAYDSIVCVGDSVTFKEVLSYYDKADPYWVDSARIAQGKELVWWDFDKGNGFEVKKPETKVYFLNEGVHHIRMASKDSTGCVDTFRFDVQAVKADAYIRSMPDTFYCNDNIVRFYDSSFGSPQIPGDVVIKWDWSFGDAKNNSLLKDPYHFYSSFGEKKVQVAVKSKAGCIDTAYKTIQIVGPVPQFKIVSDSIGCDPLKVEFENTSDHVKTWIWSMGDPAKTVISTDKDTGFSFTYSPPGTYTITLYGADSIYNPNTGNTYFCASTFPDTPMVKQVIVIPNYPVDFDIPDTICEGNPFTIKSLAANRYDDFRWWLGNGDSIFTDTESFQYTYFKSGAYRIDFKPTYTPNSLERLCISDTFKKIIAIPIKADFDISPNSIAPLYYFTNKSTNAVRYEWDFGHPKSGKDNKSQLQDPSHNYKIDLGSFTVCLRAFNKEGCVDTVCKTVENDYTPHLFIPNVFTPQGKDTLNKRFDIDIYRALTYHLSIFNRWGEKVFEGFDDGEGNNDPFNWDGTHYATGMQCPPGVYFVVFEYEILGIDGSETYKGTLTLFRED